MDYATDGQCIQETWYCARTTAGREQRLVDVLNRLNVETFLPRFTQTTYRNVTRFHPVTAEYKVVRQTVETKRALYPGYLFARLGDYEWAAVKTRLGVTLRPQWVKHAGAPAEVDPTMFSLMVEQQDKPLPIHSYKPGDGVEILSGPFAGFTGLFSHDETERVMVLLSMLGRTPIIPFEHSQVQPWRPSYADRA